MRSKLMYIWDNKDQPGIHDQMQERVAIAHDFGYEVLKVANRPERTAEELKGLLDELSECVGLWLDMPARDAGDSTEQLVAAAHDAGLKLLAQANTRMQAEESLLNIIGHPGQMEASQQ